MWNDPNLDHVNIYAYTKFGKILSINSQDIERKRNSKWNSDISHFLGYNSVTIVRKMMCNNPNLDLVRKRDFRTYIQRYTSQMKILNMVIPILMHK